MTFFTSEFVKEARISQADSDQRFITQETADLFIEAVNEATEASKKADTMDEEKLKVVIQQLDDQIEHIHNVFELIAIY